MSAYIFLIKLSYVFVFSGGFYFTYNVGNSIAVLLHPSAK